MNFYLLHGWGGSKQSLESLSNELNKLTENKHNFFILELPGHGSDLLINSTWSMKQFSDWLNSILDKNNSQKILIGHSFGGKTILDYLINYDNDNIVKTFLINISGIKPKTSLKLLFWKYMSIIMKPLTLVIPKQVKKLIYYYIIKERDYVNTTSFLKKTFKVINNEHYDHLIDKIEKDTVIIWGKDDSITPLWMGEKLHKGIKNSKMVVLEGKHNLPIQDYKTVADIIVKNL